MSTTNVALEQHKRPLLLGIVSMMVLTVGVSSAAVARLPRANYTDVPADHPYASSIEYLASGFSFGYPDSTFRPDTRINRAEFVKILTNPTFIRRRTGTNCIRNYGAYGEQPFFTDVPQDSWYAQAVCTAFERGVINGHPDGTFRPGDYVTFAEASKMLVSVFTANIQSYTPHSEEWYVAYMNKMSERNAIPLTIKTADQTVTRAEIAEMIYRLKTADTSRPSVAAQELMQSTQTVATETAR